MVSWQTNCMALVLILAHALTLVQFTLCRYFHQVKDLSTLFQENYRVSCMHSLLAHQDFVIYYCI